MGNIRLKICLLSYRSNPRSGGQGIYIKFLSKALADLGHKVDVISSEPFPELDSRVRLIKIFGLNLFEKENHITALKFKHLFSFTDFFEWISMLTGGFSEPYTFGRRVLKYFKRNDSDYDIIHDNQSLCHALISLKQKGWPVLATIHHPISLDLKIAIEHEKRWQYKLLINRWHHFLKMQKSVAKQIDQVVTVSESSRNDIEKDFGVARKNITVIHNGIDTEIFKPLPQIERNSETIMTTTSSDSPLKGLSYLLKAVAALTEEFPSLHLNILGKVNEGGTAARLIKELNLGSKVSFFSDISTREIVELYAKASCAVVPSLYEGFGLPAGEAMACEVPVVSTDGGALPEVVGEAGLIVMAGDHQALKESIAFLLKNPYLRKEYGKKGRERIMKKFSWYRCAKQMEYLYVKSLKASGKGYVS
ncbi:MAG: glycosyltransferase family 4 protein [Pseudomonadota bacterium]|nr:glycosyltransferase family 4 protein [Pseudomonadota bacterium]